MAQLGEGSLRTPEFYSSNPVSNIIEQFSTNIMYKRQNNGKTSLKTEQFGMPSNDQTKVIMAARVQKIIQSYRWQLKPESEGSFLKRAQGRGCVK